jgi:hypothetical protein
MNLRSLKDIALRKNPIKAENVSKELEHFIGNVQNEYWKRYFSSIGKKVKNMTKEVVEKKSD